MDFCCVYNIELKLNRSFWNNFYCICLIIRKWTDIICMNFNLLFKLQERIETNAYPKNAGSKCCIFNQCIIIMVCHKDIFIHLLRLKLWCHINELFITLFVTLEQKCWLILTFFCVKRMLIAQILVHFFFRSKISHIK